jgi:chemotaxis protein MotB
MSGHGKGGKRGGHEEEEHENAERWLVTYADMLTLLMVLFIVLFAISQVDQKKFAALKDGLASGFGSPSVAFAGTNTTINDSANDNSPMDIGSGVGAQSLTPDQQAVQAAVAAKEIAKQQSMQAAAKQEVQNFEEIKEKIVQELQKRGTTDSVRFTIDERGLVVTIITSSVVFAGDRADLLAGGKNILDGVGPAIGPLPNRIEVDGHTNQLNVPTINYPSGWELSSARASGVVRYLHDHAAIAESRLTAVGYADTKPLYDPSDPRAETLNRRVEIVVLSTLPAAESALLPSAVSTSSSMASGSSTASGSTTTSGSTTAGTGTGGTK